MNIHKLPWANPRTKSVDGANDFLVTRKNDLYFFGSLHRHPIFMFKKLLSVSISQFSLIEKVHLFSWHIQGIWSRQ